MQSVVHAVVQAGLLQLIILLSSCSSFMTPLMCFLVVCGSHSSMRAKKKPLCNLLRRQQVQPAEVFGESADPPYRMDDPRLPTGLRGKYRSLRSEYLHACSTYFVLIQFGILIGFRGLPETTEGADPTVAGCSFFLFYFRSLPPFSVESPKMQSHPGGLCLYLRVPASKPFCLLI